MKTNKVLFAAAAALGMFLSTGVAAAERKLSLADAIALARVQRSEMAQAAVGIEEAELGVFRAALARVRLVVDAQYVEQYQRLYINASPEACDRLGEPSPCSVRHNRILSSSASLTIPIWSGLALEAGWSQARNNEQVAQALKASSARSIALEVALAYWEVRRAELELSASEAAYERYSAIAFESKAKADAGIVPSVDSARAQSTLLRQQATVAELRGRTTAARAALAAALQVQDNIVLTEDPETRATPLPALSRIVTEALNQRPELKAVQAQLGAAEDGVRVERGAFWPQVSLFGRADVSNQLMQMQQSRAIGNFTAGIMVDWKIFDSLDNYTNVRTAALSRDRTIHALIRQRTLIRAEVQMAHAHFESALAQREPLTKALETARTSSDMLKRRYLSGAALLIEFLQAEEDRSDLERAVVENAIAIAEARAALNAARGATLF